MLPVELERDAFRTPNREFGWTRAQATIAIDALCRHGLAILGGELWYVKDGTVQPSVPEHQGVIFQELSTT
jgi:hypothetical protein